MERIAIAQYEGASSTLRVPPLAAGLLASTLRRQPDLADLAIDVHAARVPVERAAQAVAGADLLGISLYTWNARYALEVARVAKARRPELVIVAGGPSVPRRPPESAAFLDAHPWLDALVHGEGELAFVEIARAVRAGASLATLAGVVVRDASGPPRVRLDRAGFDRIGSPYLDGTFDALVERGEIPAIAAVVLETNRGCPFSCTFCDWGQATQSRVVELPLERIERELAWIADRRISYLYLVDANFGIRRRDVEITRAIGRVAERRGSPSFVFFHLTKNATASNLRTVEILREHGVGTQVALSMQDFDADVLVAIRRANIRPDAALALRERCNARGLPTVNELMLGLPAQTAGSVRRSLAAALTPFAGDTFFLYPTRVLANAELADPAYRARYGIETRSVPYRPAGPGEDLHVVEHEELVVATASLPVADWREAYAAGYLLAALWNQRLLRTTLHVLQFALGIAATTLIDALLASPAPRLAAIRAELMRFADAIVDGDGSTLVVDGWGSSRREPGDAVCARVFDDARGFYAEAADVAASIGGAVLRDAVGWDALRAAERGTVRFDHDWLAYQEQMATSPAPIARPLAVRVTPAEVPADRGVALEALQHARPRIERGPLPFEAAPRAGLRERAREDGFVYLPRLLPVERLAPLRSLVDAALIARGWIAGGRTDPALRFGRWDDPRWHAFLADVLPSEPYRELASAPELLAAVGAIVGGEPQLHVGDVCRLVSPGAVELTTPPHQDAAYLAGADDAWTAWIPLVPCPLALGPLAMLAGSHTGGVRPHAPVAADNQRVVGTQVAEDAPWRTLDLELGDVILFSALTIHRALPNTTADQLRVSVGYRYRPAH